jgi:hypothetical protein
MGSRSTVLVILRTWSDDMPTQEVDSKGGRRFTIQESRSDIVRWGACDERRDVGRESMVR